MKKIMQKFNKLKTQYRLNKAKNKLEELPDKIDIQKQINSFKQYSLDSILNRFLGVDDLANVKDVSHQRNIDRLDLMNHTQGIIDDYCYENGLQKNSMTLEKIIEHIKSKIKKVEKVEKEHAQEDIKTKE